MKAKTANRIWLASLRRVRARFFKECLHPQAVQRDRLRTYLRANRDTVFGRTHDFAKIKNEYEFEKAVPLRDRDEFDVWTRRIAAGETGVLTREPVLFLEETSGSTGPAALVPYTRELRREFQRALGIWLPGLYRRNPAAFAGPAYWSLSPAAKRRRSSGGLPIGAAQDSSYLSPLSAYFLRRILAVPEALAALSDPHEFYVHTLAELLVRSDLALISVWSPTFFLRLDEFLRENHAEIVEFVNTARSVHYPNHTDNRNYPHGSYNAPGALLSRERLALLRGGDFRWSELWPGLALMSCWTDASSALWIDRLRDRLGPVPIEGKGLLATEGVVSLPIDAGDPVLALGCHYYEFRALADGAPRQPHELKAGDLYEVLLTTGGGLYRYATGDVIEVTGFYQRIPRLRFVGRTGRNSDLVGEKISEHQVSRALQRIKAGPQGAAFEYACLTTECRDDRPRYLLLLQAAPGATAAELRAVTAACESELRRNPYYDQARRLEQLGPLEHRTVDSGFAGRLAARLRAGGNARDGAFKPPVLAAAATIAGLEQGAADADREANDAPFRHR